MSDKPIIFSGPMVRALLDGAKTQTRRVLPSAHPKFPHHNKINPDALALDPKRPAIWYWDGVHDYVGASHNLPYAAGDRLWVREAFSYDRLDVDRDGTLPPWHWADGNPSSGDWSKPKPSIHMPRWASRLTLTVTDVRVQRLRDIIRGDAMAEGCPFANMADGPDPRAWFQALWGQLHPSIIKRSPGSSKSNPAAWAANPWVAAYTFTVQRWNIDKLEARNG